MRWRCRRAPRCCWSRRTCSSAAAARWQVAIVLLVAIGVVNLLKGLDFEESAGRLGVAALLFGGRAPVHRRAGADHAALGGLAGAADRHAWGWRS